MTTEANQAVAHQFFECFTENEIHGALDTMADDATWRLPGKKESSPSAGLYPKDEVGSLYKRMVNALQDGLKMTVVSCIAEGDRVALEVVSTGDLKNGR